ncbi:hypothetical protein EI555_008559, partial [Monodon monoceros]
GIWEEADAGASSGHVANDGGVRLGAAEACFAVKLVDGDGLEFRKCHSGPAFGINSILYQRGLYPSETFTRVQKYGLTLLKLVVVISNIESGEVLERWQFDIECDKTAKDDSAPREKSEKAIQDEIRSVIRQITATVTFLPLLKVSCSFDLLIYTDKDLVVPEKWEESGPQFITNSEEVRLRSFTTTIHKDRQVGEKKDSQRYPSSVASVSSEIRSFQSTPVWMYPVTIATICFQ